MLLQFGKHLILDNNFYKEKFKIMHFMVSIEISKFLSNLIIRNVSYMLVFYKLSDYKIKSIALGENITDVIHFKYSKTFSSKIREIAT